MMCDGNFKSLLLEEFPYLVAAAISTTAKHRLEWNKVLASKIISLIKKLVHSNMFEMPQKSMAILQGGHIKPPAMHIFIIIQQPSINKTESTAILAAP